ncbi:MAG: hypothetical protein M0R48_02475 [Candidatus Omnitrophica bacterium]|jgi:hypothetical protein|nr:hypothetical protein [Candidatus Omnitrophota bacterium]
MAQYLKLPQLHSRVFLYGIVLIIIISGTLKINQNIANKGQGYFVLKNIDQANEAARLGYIKYEVNDYAEAFGLKWESKPGIRRIIRSGPDDFDDIGYISMLELIALGGKKMTLGLVEQLHNIVFILSLVMLAFAVRKLCNNIFAGWLFLILALIFKKNILSLVYGSPDSRTFVISFSCAVMFIIFSLNWLKKYFFTAKGSMAILFFGMIVGIMMLFRSSEGLAATCAIYFCIIFLNVKLREKITSALIIFLGIFFVTIILPIGFALHRDIKTGEFTGDLKPYLQTTGRHAAWHSLVAGLGRYPNSLGMRYSDIVLYDLVRAKYPKAMHPKLNIQGEGYYDVLQKIYFQYVANHPIEYIKNVAQGYLELFYVIPYVTSVGNLPWFYGYLPIKPGVIPYERDKAWNVNGLVCLRLFYLRLSSTEWITFFLAFFSIAAAVVSTFFGVPAKTYRGVFLAIVFYLFLLATQRALIPNHGLNFIVAFWIFSIISFLYICFTDNVARYFFCHKLKVLIKNYKIRRL